MKKLLENSAGVVYGVYRVFRLVFRGCRNKTKISRIEEKDVDEEGWLRRRAVEIRDAILHIFHRTADKSMASLSHFRYASLLHAACHSINPRQSVRKKKRLNFL